MADTQLTVSEEDVAAIKAKEDVRQQVLLQLQQGLCGDADISDNTVEAIEAQQEDCKEVEYGYPITCGESKAVLLIKKFVCPGINVKCVKYNEQLISPKQFVHLAGKATLKDWKRAIRLGGVMLRKMMDSGQIDFYQHDTLCSNTCRSTKFDLLINNTRFPSQSSLLAMPASPRPAVNGSQVALMDEVTTAALDLDSDPAAEEQTEVKTEVESISDETLSFWKGIAEVGLMGEVVSNIRTELLALLRGVQLRSGQAALQESDAAALNSLAQMFGLLDSVKRSLQKRRRQSHFEKDQIDDRQSKLEDKREAAYESRPRSSSSKRARLQLPTPSQHVTLFSPISTDLTGQSFSLASLPVASLAQLSAASRLLSTPGALPTRLGVLVNADLLHLAQEFSHMDPPGGEVELIGDVEENDTEPEEKEEDEEEEEAGVMLQEEEVNGLQTEQLNNMETVMEQ